MEMSGRFGKFLDKSRKTIGSENIVVFAIGIILTFSQLRQLLGAAINVISGNGILIATGFLMLVGLCTALIALPVVMKALNRVDWVIFGVSSLITAISFFFSTNQAVFFYVFKTTIARCIPLYLLFRAIENPLTFFTKARVIAYVLLVFELLSVTVWRSGWDRGYSMSLGDETLSTLTIFLISLLIKWRWPDLFAGSLSLVIIFLAGTRGPFFIALAILGLFILYCFIKRKFHSVMRLVGLAVVSVVLFLGTSLLAGSISFVGILTSGEDDRMVAIDPSASRILALQNNNKLFLSTPRFRIYASAWDIASNNLFLGTGIINDRIALSGEGADDEAKAKGIASGYAHNIALEVLLQFGLLPGAGLMIAYIVFLVSAYRRLEDYENRVFFLALCCLAIPPLITSHSYLQYPMFYAFNGYMISRFQAGAHKTGQKADTQTQAIKV